MAHRGSPSGCQIPEAQVGTRAPLQAAYYREHSPDLALMGRDALWAHFVLHGQLEARPFRFKCRPAPTSGATSSDPVAVVAEALRAAQQLEVCNPGRQPQHDPSLPDLPSISALESIFRKVGYCILTLRLKQPNLANQYPLSIMCAPLLAPPGLGPPPSSCAQPIISDDPLSTVERTEFSQRDGEAEPAGSIPANTEADREPAAIMAAMAAAAAAAASQTASDTAAEMPAVAAAATSTAGAAGHAASDPEAEKPQAAQPAAALREAEQVRQAAAAAEERRRQAADPDSDAAADYAASAADRAASATTGVPHDPIHAAPHRLVQHPLWQSSHWEILVRHASGKRAARTQRRRSGLALLLEDLSCGSQARYCRSCPPLRAGKSAVADTIGRQYESAVAAEKEAAALAAAAAAASSAAEASAAGSQGHDEAASLGSAAVDQQPVGSSAVAADNEPLAVAAAAAAAEARFEAKMAARKLPRYDPSTTLFGGDPLVTDTKEK